jgi:hypothetical protein
MRASSALRADAGFAHVAHDLGEPRGAGSQRQLVGPVHLLGDVGGVEVGEARPDEGDDARRVQFSQRCGQRRPVAPGRLRPHRRHESQRLGAFVVGNARIEELEQRGDVVVER